jgi:hypothetical protein
MKILIILFICLTLNGCVTLPDYGQIVPNVSVRTKERLSVGVLDHRPYILNHDKEEYFIGIQRGGFGIPISLQTPTAKPLAEDMTNALVNALKNTGTTVNSIKITPTTDMNSVLQIAKSQQSEKVIILTLQNFKTDTYQATDFIYDLSLSIFDLQGHELATKRVQGTDNLGRDMLTPQSIVTKFAPQAFQKKLEELFNGDISVVLNRIQ